MYVYAYECMRMCAGFNLGIVENQYKFEIVQII